MLKKPYKQCLKVTLKIAHCLWRQFLIQLYKSFFILLNCPKFTFPMSHLINYDYQNIIIMMIFVKGSGQISALPNRLES